PVIHYLTPPGVFYHLIIPAYITCVTLPHPSRCLLSPHYPCLYNLCYITSPLQVSLITSLSQPI
ncbi:hypothetical protein DPEC_G00158240, partial [Dallia pectoralis]